MYVTLFDENFSIAYDRMDELSADDRALLSPLIEAAQEARAVESFD